MSKQGAMAPDEDINGLTSHGSSIDHIHHNQFEVMSSSRAGNPLLDQSHYSNNQPARQRTIQSFKDQVKTVTNELYKHIIYYPIYDIADSARIIAILEVAYKKKLSRTDELLTEDI